jgi:hypothetical protein
MRNILRQAVVLLLLILIVVPMQPALAQSALDRIDEAMAHLSGYLGLNSTITRQSHYWTWSEQIYSDAGMDCPAQGAAYAATPTRGYHIIINYNNIDYNYYATTDGVILVLCGNGGIPIYRSDSQILGQPIQPVQPVDPVISGGSMLLPASEWFSWIYMDGSDLLYLVNENGAQMIVRRPQLLGEVGLPGPNNLQMAISRDGRYLLEAVRLPSGSMVLGLYDFVTGELANIMETQPNEEISLGWEQGASIGGSMLIFDANSGMVAVGIANLSIPGTSEWRVAIIDLSTAAIITQIREMDMLFLISGGDQMLMEALQGNGGTYMPRPVYFDNGNGIHIQLIYMFAGGAAEYPAFVWYPNTNTAAPSDYDITSMDILPTTGMALYAYLHTGIPSLPADGPYEPSNAIAKGAYLNPNVFQTQVVYTNSSMLHFAPQWMSGGEMIVFEGGIASDNLNWILFNPGTLEPAVQLADTYDSMRGMSAGALAFSESVSGFSLTLIEDASTRSIVWTAPPMNGMPNIVWVQSAGVPLALNSIALNAYAYPPDGSGVQPVVATAIPGAVHCAGAPASIISVGISARVTITNSGPLNVRSQAGTGHPVSRILPEGTEFNVVGGPLCVDGYTWWRVILQDNVYGWAAEGNASGYFIEPWP